MKATIVLTLIATFATSGIAAPTAGQKIAIGERDQAGILDIFGLPGRIFNEAFDGASCIVSTFFGGRGPLCSGRASLSTGGNLVVTTKADTSTSNNNNSNNKSFTYTYTTADNGKIKITIKPDTQGKNECTTTVDPNGRELKDLVREAADKCL